MLIKCEWHQKESDSSRQEQYYKRIWQQVEREINSGQLDSEHG